MEITRRHHLRKDELNELRGRLAELFGADIEGERFESVEFADRDFELVLVDDEPHILRTDDEDVLTVHGANASSPDRRIVTVDAGAVPFVSDGADIMRPGIVEADEHIAAGDPVLIAEETHGKILAVGKARVSGEELLGDEGKVVQSIHHVGDEIFEFRP